MSPAEAAALILAHAEWAAGVNATEHYEQAAEAFWRDTGLTAPGKSSPMEFGDGDIEERRRAWAEWHRAQAVKRLEAANVLMRAVGGAR